MSEEFSLDEYKAAWREMEVREAGRAFMAHLAAYVIVNVFLAFINLWAYSGTIWFVWPLAGWGVGLAFHFIFSRPGHVVSEVRKKEALAELIARERRG